MAESKVLLPNFIFRSVILISFIFIYFLILQNAMFWSLHIISSLFIRISNFFSCSLNNVTKDRTDDIILTSRCWTTTFVFPVLWTTFCRAVFPLFSSAHAIMTRAFLFASSSVIWIPLPTMKLYLYLINNEIWHCYFLLYLVDVFSVAMWKWLKPGGNRTVLEEQALRAFRCFFSKLQ